MSFLIDYNNELDLIYVEIFDHLDYTSARKIIQQIVSKCKKHGVTNILSNHSSVNSVPSFVDIFNLGTFASQLMKGLNLALVCPTEFMEDYNLYKRTVNKRGGHIQIFADRNSAINWLDNPILTV